MPGKLFFLLSHILRRPRIGLRASASGTGRSTLFVIPDILAVSACMSENPAEADPADDVFKQIVIKCLHLLGFHPAPPVFLLVSYDNLSLHPILS